MEKSNPKIQDELIVPLSGIRTDTPPNSQPENTTRFVLNGMNTSSQDGSYRLVNEAGDEIKYFIREDYTVVGTIALPNNQTVIFAVNDAETSGLIGVAQDDTYTELMVSTCLTLSKKHPVTGTYKIRNGCERIVYFCDGENPDRAINLDNLEQYETSPGVYDCDLFDIVKVYERPTFTLDSVNDSGGILKLGTYQFAFRYLDGDLNETEYFGHTNPIPIVDETLSSPYNSIDGGFNLPEKTTDEGAKPPTSKSITFTLTNVDTSYSYLDIAVIAYNVGDGITQAVYEVERLPINSGTITYTFAGIDDDDIDSSLSEITQRYAKWSVSETMMEFDNRLLRGNVKETQRDWGVFQQAVNDFQTEYVTYDIDPTDITDYSPKNPETTFQRLNFMRDEVYDIGIVVEFTDGSESPTLHLPGRQKNKTHDGSTISDTSDPHHSPTFQAGGMHYRVGPSSFAGWDSTPIGRNITNRENDTWHLDGGSGTGADFERWEVYNTAIRTAQNSGGYYSRGELAYFESTIAYPDSEDCNGTRIYPTGNIRFHKMPDATLEPIYKGTTATNSNAAQQAQWNLGDDNPRIFQLGLLISNISWPAAYSSQIAGYRIVAKKLDTVKTKGYFAFPEGTTIANTKLLGTASWGVDNPLAVQFYSPEQYFDKLGFAGAYFHFERLYWANLASNAASRGFLDLGTTAPVRGIGDGVSTASSIHYTPLTYAYVDADSSSSIEDYGGTSHALDGTSCNDMLIWTPASVENRFAIGTAASLDNGTNVTVYGAIKNSNRTFNFVNSLYHSLHTNLFTGATAEVFGDTHISALHPEMHDGTNNWYMNAYCESPINSEYRHSATSIAESLYYPRNFTNWYDQFTDLPRTKLYNKDYSRLNETRVYASIPLSWKFCDNCANEYPNVIAYSDVSADDIAADGFLRFLANNYTLLPGNGGGIKGMFSINRSLFVHTEQMLYQLAPSARTLDTSVDTIYVGTGDLFSIPAAELIRTDYGYAGCQGRYAYKSTEYGHFFVDQQAGKIYKFQDGLQPISDLGESNWFKKNLPSELLKAFREAGITYHAEDAITHPYGVGIQIGYDPRFHRIIIHKRDWKPLFQFVEYDATTNYEVGAYVYDPAAENFYEMSGFTKVQAVAPDTHKALFESKNWTRSFDPRQNSWTSFHSYNPLWMFNTRENWYKSFFSNYIYGQTPNENFTTYFGTKYPFIVELVSRNPLTRSLDVIEMVHDVDIYDSTADEWRAVDDVTWDTITAYNSDQCTGELTVDVKTRTQTYTSPWDNTTCIAERSDNNWRFARFRDIVTNRNDTLFTKDWADATYNGYFDENTNQGYIDKVLNTSVLNTSLSQYQLAKLKDKYSITRFKFQPAQDYMMSVDLINSINKQSVR